VAEESHDHNTIDTPPESMRIAEANVQRQTISREARHIDAWPRRCLWEATGAQALLRSIGSGVRHRRRSH